MRTTFHTRQPYADLFLQCARDYKCKSAVRPENFIRKMHTNQGSIAALTGLGMDPDGLERKNPVIVALGDSVTAGHFEGLYPEAAAEYDKILLDRKNGSPMERALPPVEITDARESYVEKFRLKLIDQFERTSVSILNAGIAGDNLVQMAARAQRDVVRYQPDLVLINGALNWSEELGSADYFKEVLRGLVRRIKKETAADIILLTPNGELPNVIVEGEEAKPVTTPERVAAIRKIAQEECVCLADVYAVWEAAREAGCPWEELLANRVNHPGIEGHEVYAMILMKLII